jgi:polyhydroxyalkanoate synthesis regulator phasin
MLTSMSMEGVFKKRTESISRPSNPEEDKKARAFASIAWEAKFNRGYTDVVRLVEIRDRLVAEGTIEAREANSLPEVRAAGERSLAVTLQPDAIHHAAFNTERFIAERNRWVEAGIFTTEEANGLPRIRGIARDDLFGAAAAVNSDQNMLLEVKNRLVEVGILSQDEAEHLIQEGEAKRRAHVTGA